MKLLLLITSLPLAHAAKSGFCSYPMWSIPEVGTDTRCDNGRNGCPKRIDEVASPECTDSFGVAGGATCVVRCASDHDGSDNTEAWQCSDTDFETWELVGDSLDCSSEEISEKKEAISLESWKEMARSFQFVPVNGTAAKVGAAGVCEQMVEFIPDVCSCEDTELGGTAHCTVDISTNGTDDDPPFHVDTINMDLELNVCDEPMNINFHIEDELVSNDLFDYKIEAGEADEVGTGLIIPLEIAAVELMLSYELGGTIDKLYMKFGFDLMATVVIAEVYCSSLYSGCPLWFLEAEEDFGDTCA
ncbi:hypothetical protein TrVE_jg10273 [Triparma verrucosa]|uniref:Uncharacterized protein n=2 Tax=Triparma TaxID=722752 RepID=A0A9W7BVG2_9STRA|nr:hypothetical protein TrST_g13725 [Triparma strigata]GMH99230.1 hypothetical protein TrVE_jg10273 [Triparma verrucosa]